MSIYVFVYIFYNIYILFRYSLGHCVWGVFLHYDLSSSLMLIHSWWGWKYYFQTFFKQNVYPENKDMNIAHVCMCMSCGLLQYTHTHTHARARARTHQSQQFETRFVGVD